VNLRSWYLSEFGSDSHQIETNLWTVPNAYVVLARTGDMAINGVIVANYVYSGIELANGDDELSRTQCTTPGLLQRNN